MDTYLVAGPHPAYGAAPGAHVELDSSDPNVRQNAAAGIVTLVSETSVECPVCVESGAKKPARLKRAELATHYGDEHPGFVVPTPE